MSTQRSVWQQAEEDPRTTEQMLADKMASEHGQSWNSISARRIRAALGPAGADRQEQP